MESLEEAKKCLLSNLDEGTTCPCCGQHAQRYRRKLNADMAKALIQIYKAWMAAGGGNTWIDIKSVDVRGGDYGKLAHWGLLEHRPSEGTVFKWSGHWRLSSRGVSFVKNGLTVPSHVYVYNGKLQSVDTSETTTIKLALGSKFNYEELMRGA